MRNPFTTNKMEEVSKPIEDKKDKDILTKIKESVDEKEEQITSFYQHLCAWGFLFGLVVFSLLLYQSTPPKHT